MVIPTAILILIRLMIFGLAEEVYVSCEYDHWSDRSLWSFAAYTEGTEWIAAMSVSLDGQHDGPSPSVSEQVAFMSFQGGDEWSGAKTSSYYYCGYAVDLEFMADDGYGNVAYASVWW